MNTKRFRVALVQYHASGQSIGENTEKACEFIRQAAAEQVAADQAAAEQAAQGDAAGESAQTTDDGAAQNEAAIAALSAESPRFYLTQYSVELERGAELNELSYVQDISDDEDSRDELYQGIRISGEVDTNTPGEYTLEYHVVDSDGNNSNVAQLRVTVK